MPIRPHPRLSVAAVVESLSVVETPEQISGEGMRGVSSSRRDMRRWFVLAFSYEQFLRWVKAGGEGRDLQLCKYLTSEEDMRGVGFSSLTVELICLSDWNSGRHEEFIEAAAHLCARYCRDRRVHSVPTADV